MKMTQFGESRNDESDSFSPNSKDLALGASSGSIVSYKRRKNRTKQSAGTSMNDNLSENFHVGRGLIESIPKNSIASPPSQAIIDCEPYPRVQRTSSPPPEKPVKPVPKEMAPV